MRLSRRQSLGLFGAGGALLMSADSLRPQAAAVQAAPDGAPAFGGKHAVVPLPFDPKSLRGLSEKLIVSHHDNNYAGAVRNLNKVEQELGRVDSSTASFALAGLKQAELAYRNSMVLHERYFGNLGGDSSASGAVATALASAYGSVARWEESFRATGASLGGGSGWAVLAYDLNGDAVQTVWSNTHAMALAFGVPLLVMDMYEHAYQMDYGAGAAKYIDAFFGNLRWEEVERRFEQARKAAAALRA